MRARLQRLIFAIRTNFWFIPTLISIAAVLAAYLMIQVDYGLSRDPELTQRLPTRMEVESARLALSTIAGSMITVSTLVFSMTLVALTTVSQQLGPRIIMRFMDDRPIQIVLGTFVAAFLFSLILLMRVGDQAVEGEVPGIGVTTAAALAVLALAAMITFFDHVARRVQADAMINELGNELDRAAEEFVSPHDNAKRYPDPQELAALTAEFETRQLLCIAAPGSGYLRTIDADSLASFATRHELVVRIEKRPGEFVLSGEPVMSAASNGQGSNAPPEKLEEDLVEWLYVGGRRTPEASIEFEIRALVEVALRALSPGINDPFTAIACIDNLADGLRVLAQRTEPYRVHRDSDGNIRVLHAPEPFERYLELGYRPIAQAARGMTIVINRLREALAELHDRVEHESHRAAIDEMRRKL